MDSYLPSKQFVTRLISIAIIIAIVFGIYKLVIFLKNRTPGGAKALIVKPDVIQKDSNKNGIPDWEESLWGLDPRGDGSSNKEFILAKREKLAKENNIDTKSGEPLSENETLSREFFAIIMSLQESGDLNENSIESVSNTIGEKITAVPIPDIYDNGTVKVVKSNPANIDAYYISLSKLLDKYTDQDIGNELTFISVGLSSGDPGAMFQAKTVASSYRFFGEDLIGISVPSNLIGVHRSLANDYEKVAQSIEGMSQMLDDPIVGMKAIINYKRYTDALASDFETLSNELQ